MGVKIPAARKLDLIPSTFATMGDASNSTITNSLVLKKIFVEENPTARVNLAIRGIPQPEAGDGGIVFSPFEKGLTIDNMSRRESPDEEETRTSPEPDPADDACDASDEDNARCLAVHSRYSI